MFATVSITIGESQMGIPLDKALVVINTLYLPSALVQKMVPYSILVIAEYNMSGSKISWVPE